jgi:hypothetical protein
VREIKGEFCMVPQKRLMVNGLLMLEEEGLPPPSESVIVTPDEHEGPELSWFGASGMRMSSAESSKKLKLKFRHKPRWQRKCVVKPNMVPRTK